MQAGYVSDFFHMKEIEKKWDVILLICTGFAVLVPAAIFFFAVTCLAVSTVLFWLAA